MYQTIPFQQRQGVRPTDLNRLQTSVRKTVDKLTQQLLLRATWYTGLNVSKTSATQLAVSAGTLWQNGAEFIRDDTAAVDLTAYLPLGSNKKIVAIVATGTEAVTLSEPVRFLTDVATRASVANTVAVANTRTIQYSVVEGAESLAPVAPAVATDLALLALVTLSSSGVVGTPEQDVDQRAPNLQDMYVQQLIFASQLAGMRAQINSLASDLAGLARLLQGKADRVEITRHEAAIRDLREAAGIQDRNSWLGRDSFANADESDTGHADYDATVDNGLLTLPAPALVKKPFALLNPTDPKLKFHASIALPDYTEELAYELASKEATIALADYTSVTHTRVKKFHGYLFKWFKTKHGGLEKTMKKTGGLVRLLDPETDEYVKLDLDKYDWEKRGDFGPGVWVYIADYKPYWAIKTSSASITGATVAQTWFNAQAGWLTAVGIYVRELGASGSIRLNVFECDEQNSPDLGNTLEEVVVDHADLVVGWNKIVLPDPVHISKGVRYGWSAKSSGAHKLWASNTNDGKGGTAFYANGGVWDPQLNLDLSYRLYTAKFKKARVEVSLDPVAVAGGISEMDFTLTGVRPAAADFDILAQIAGVWRSIDGNDLNVFSTEPNLVPLKAVWSNSAVDAVGIVIAKSRIYAYKPDNTGVHISTARTLPDSGEAATITIDYFFTQYDAGHHTITPRLLHGASYATSKTPASSAWTTLANGQKRLRSIYTFTAATRSTPSSASSPTSPTAPPTRSR